MEEVGSGQQFGEYWWTMQSPQHQTLDPANAGKVLHRVK